MNKQIVIIEPHHDDAIYSIGGIIQKLRNSKNVHLITVFSNSQIFNPNYKVSIPIGSIRRKETEKVIKELDINWTGLEFIDKDLSKNEITSDEIFFKIKKKLELIIKNDDLVFLPAGFGDNPHHIIVSRLRHIYKNHILYEDTVPVKAYSRVLDSFMPLYSKLYKDYEPFYFDISGQIYNKIKLASVYKSQFSERSCKTLKLYAQNVAEFGKHTDYSDNSLNYAERIYIPRINSEKIKRYIFGTEEEITVKNTIKLISESENNFYERKTRRNLFGIEIQLAEVSTLLNNAAKKINTFSYLSGTYNHLPYPTAGGLENSEVFLLNFNIKDLGNGVYQYNSDKNELIYLKKNIDIIQFTEIIENQEWGLGTSFAIIINSKSKDLHKKYHSRAIQLSLLEAGHLCQNLLLVAEKLNLNAIEIGGFSKQKIINQYNIFNPLILILFSKSKTVIKDINLKKVSIKSFPVKTKYKNVGSNENYIATIKTYEFEGINVFVSRVKVLLKNHEATGVSIRLKNENIENAKSEAINKAISEADEIFNSFNIVPESLVYTTINRLKRATNYRVITFDKIKLDSIQMLKSKSLSNNEYNEDAEYHFIKGIDLIDGKPIWCPADAILISKRFWDQKIWPSSTGYGCSSDLKTSLEHSLREIVEKIIVQNYLGIKEMPLDSIINDKNVSTILMMLKNTIDDLNIYTSIIKPYIYILMESKNKNVFGSSVDTTLYEAIKTASGEITAKLLNGSNEGLTNISKNFINEKGLLEFLKDKHLSVGYTYFKSSMINTNIITKAFLYSKGNHHDAY